MKKIALFLAIALLITMLPQIALPVSAKGMASAESKTVRRYEDYLKRVGKESEKTASSVRSATRSGKTVSYIEMPAVTIEEGTCGYFSYIYDADYTGEHRLYYDYDLWQLLVGTMKIYYTDGTFSYVDEDDAYLVSLSGSEDDFDIRPGKTSTLEGHYEDSEGSDVTFTYTVTVKPRTVKVTKMEITGPSDWLNGSVGYDVFEYLFWTDDWEEDPIEYRRYNCEPIAIKAYFSDGTTLQWKEGEETGIYYGVYAFSAMVARKFGLSEDDPYEFMDFNSYQTPDVKWGLGEHKAEFGLLGSVFDYTVKVVENPIKSVKAFDISIEEGTSGYMEDAWDPETYEPIPGAEWFCYVLDSNMNYQLTFTDGSTKNYSFYELTEQFNRWPNVITDQGWENPWGVGTHQASVEFGGKTCTFKVNITPGSCPSRKYTDVPGEGNWAHAGIDFCIERGIMGSTRTDALTFEPNATCTRAMIVTILYSMSGSPSVTYTPKFPDVPKGAWFTKAIMWAYQNGVVTGYDTGKFGPNDKITREQMAVILKAYTEKVARRDTSASVSLSAYPDANKVTWSKKAVSWAVAEGLISGVSSNGKNYIMPAGNATRAQVATILMSYYKRVLSKPVKGSYEGVIRQAIAARDAVKWDSTGEGLLYDFDGNGTDELVMLYSAMQDTGDGVIPYMVCSAYAQKNGEVVTLIDELPLMTVAGGEGSTVGIVRRSGKTYLLAKWETGEYDPEGTTTDYGEWYLYEINGAEINLTTYVRFDLALDASFNVIKSESSAYFNGEYKSYDEYNSWCTGLSWLKILNGYDDGDGNGVSLEKLLSQCG